MVGKKNPPMRCLNKGLATLAELCIGQRGPCPPLAQTKCQGYVAIWRFGGSQPTAIQSLTQGKPCHMYRMSSLYPCIECFPQNIFDL